MTYFPDLAPYGYRNNEPNAWSIGWLDGRDDYPQWGNQYDPIFGDALAMMCANHGALVNLCKGSHGCELCTKHNPKPGSGNGEIRVSGEKGVYAAPVLIEHYVRVHSYRPPQEFIDAVKASVYGEFARSTRRDPLPEPRPIEPLCSGCGRNDRYWSFSSRLSDDRMSSIHVRGCRCGAETIELLETYTEPRIQQKLKAVWTIEPIQEPLVKFNTEELNALDELEQILTKEIAKDILTEYNRIIHGKSSL